jgi:hypothetical protein
MIPPGSKPAVESGGPATRSRSEKTGTRPRHRDRESGRDAGRTRSAQRKKVPVKKSSADKPKSRRKPPLVVPITKAMEEGREPMRTFGDLLQFHRKKEDEAPDNPAPGS